MVQQMEKNYNPKDSEQKTYSFWEEGGYFTPEVDEKKKPFTIMMPPPNANGALHAGHALFATLQDIMTRYHRMKGDSSLWLPGADHAGFETQVVFDKKLEKEGRRRHEIPKEELLKEMMDFTLSNKATMESQLRRLGASCDWSRAKFTLDKDIIDTVYSTFEKLEKDGLIYKGSRLINWCVKHQTSLSDLEIKYEERTDPLYYIKYGPFKLATVRPETKFGDTAIAVNPKDERYKKYVGQDVEVETVLGKARIKVIEDESVDMDFGTGAVKVTPAHDFADYETWQRHKDEIPGPKIVIDRYGRMNEMAGPYAGMKIGEAREKIVADMIKKGLLDEKEIEHNYKHNVAVCFKCGSVIEPALMDNQWFVKMTEKPKSGGLSLRDLAVKAVKEENIKFIPERFEKIFLQWMENLRDWNISRQIPWGIPIPGDKKQVFDTWFSSGQWPFAALKGAKKGDFEYFYPTTVMETGADIIFFWVARMVMLGIYVTGQAPFKYVYLHGLVRDKDKQKMSKSKGNVVDPLGVVELHGADALRMALVFANSPGADIAFSEEKITAQRRFANKIWNAARFVLSATEKTEPNKNPQARTQADKDILETLEKIAKEMAKDIDNFQFHEAAQKIYQFFWHTFCDVYIEESKKQMAREQGNTEQILLYVLRESLKLLHPFMPFITEEIYQMLPNKEAKALIIEKWPCRKD
ncbi:MAG: class I tRNA ligase family protein [Candidatus Pacebacteria bacterium]|nr:class I tRNA ligase family protein [Candidatus Paceibacterota bacterium]